MRKKKIRDVWKMLNTKDKKRQNIKHQLQKENVLDENLGQKKKKNDEEKSLFV